MNGLDGTVSRRNKQTPKDVDVGGSGGSWIFQFACSGAIWRGYSHADSFPKSKVPVGNGVSGWSDVLDVIG